MLLSDLMGSHTIRPQVSRLEVIETGRRRRWSDVEKLRIVAESLAGSRLVSVTARRHGISRALLTTWRRAHREGRLCLDDMPSFTPVMIAPDSPPMPPAGPGQPHEAAGRMEIALTNGRSIVVGPDVDAAALARVLDVLDRR